MKRKVSIFIVLISLCSFALAQNKIFIDIGEAKVHKSLLAFPSLQYLGSTPSRSSDRAGNEIYGVISNDLDATGLFVDVDHKAFLENTATTGLRPAGVMPNGFDFNNWKTVGAEFLIKAGYQIIGDQLSLEVYA